MRAPASVNPDNIYDRWLKEIGKAGINPDKLLDKIQRYSGRNSHPCIGRRLQEGSFDNKCYQWSTDHYPAGEDVESSSCIFDRLGRRAAGAVFQNPFPSLTCPILSLKMQRIIGVGY